MKLLLLISLASIIWSCNNGKQKATSDLSSEVKINSDSEEFKDTRTEDERKRDSIRYLNSRNFWAVITKADTIDSKQIGRSPFDTLDFNKVIAYSYDGSHEQTKIVSIGEVIGRSRTIDQQAALNQQQINKILPLFTYRKTYDPMASAGCFEPRFALVLFKNHTAVMQISVCMDCNNIDITPNIKENNDGLSKKGRKAIIAFCKELGFPYGELKQ